MTNEVSDLRLLGVGLTEAERELGLCADVVSVPNVWRRLYDLGVRGHGVTGDDYFDGLRYAAVVFLSGGLFEFGHNMRDATGAIVAVIVPMQDEEGRVQNLVACDLAFKRSARWRSTSPILGLEQTELPRLEPIRVHRDVLAWLQSERDGIAIFDFQGAALALCGGGPLAVDDAAFGRELKTKLQIAAPRILVRAGQRNAA